MFISIYTHLLWVVGRKSVEDNNIAGAIKVYFVIDKSVGETRPPQLPISMPEIYPPCCTKVGAGYRSLAVSSRKRPVMTSNYHHATFVLTEKWTLKSPPWHWHFSVINEN